MDFADAGAPGSGRGCGVRSPAALDVIAAEGSGAADPQPAGAFRNVATSRVRIRQMAPAMVPVFAGGTLGGFVAAVVAAVEGLFAAPRIPVAHTVVGVCLIGLAIGVHAPQRAAVALTLLAGRRFRGAIPDAPPAPTRSDGAIADRPFYWLVLAVILLAAGIACALSPLSLHFARAAYAYMLEHFLWAVGPLAILQTVLILGVVLIPCVMLGLSVTAIHHLLCRFGQWEPRATGWVLAGAAPGVAFTGMLATGRMGVEPVLIAASLPALVAALVAAGMSQKLLTSHAQIAGGGVDGAGPVPLATDAAPRLTRRSTVLVGIAAVVIVSLMSAASGGGTTEGLPSPIETGWKAGPALLLLGLAVGWFAACRGSTTALRCAGGLGLACAVAGMFLAPGVLAADRFLSGSVLAAVPALGAAVAGGYAAAYARYTLMARVGERSTAGATVMIRTLTGAGLMIWLAVPLATGLMGGRAAMVAVAMALLAAGGILIIYEPAFAPWRRRIHLATVFVAIGLTIMLAGGGGPGDPAVGEAMAGPSAQRSPGGPTASAPVASGFNMTRERADR